MSELVAVVVPRYRAALTPDEEQSLRQLCAVLSHHPLRFAMPESLRCPLPANARPVTFPDACFSSIQSYSALLLSRRFYDAFADFRYILIHQLDALVFSDRLAAWCHRGFDYVGAPWVGTDAAGAPVLVPGCNGGLSLRRIAAFQAVLRSTRRHHTPGSYYRKYMAGRTLWTQLWRAPRQCAKLLPIRNGAQACARDFTSNEDIFWSRHATRFLPSFAVAPPAQAVAFAFEVQPRFCHAQNQHRLPFGCHAWARYDRAFWEPHLLRD